MNFKTISCSLVTLSLLNACSSGGGGGGGSSTAPTQAQFIDAPVKGLSYTGSVSGSGKTGDNGAFSCIRGEQVKFSLKGLDLGYAACGEKVFVADLTSHTSGYTWQKAAAVIQSFSNTSSSQLDLSAAGSSSLDLSSVTYTDGSFDTTIANKVPSVPGAVAVSTATATTNANNDMAAIISLDSSLESILSGLAGTDITIKGTLSSGTTFPGYGEQCWPYVKAKGQITKATYGAKDLYTFSISSPIGYAHESNTNGFDCGSNNSCVKIDPRVVPSGKVIYSNNLDLIYSNDSVDNYEVVNGNGSTETIGDVKAKASLTPVLSASGGQLAVTGTYNTDIYIVNGAGSYALANGKTINCKYAITMNQ